MDIAPELYQNKLKASWGVNFKYNGRLYHNLDRVWVVTKVNIPKFSEIVMPAFDFDTTCEHLRTANYRISEDLYVGRKRFYGSLCLTLSPILNIIKQKEGQYVSKIKDILEKELPMALSIPLDSEMDKRSIVAIVSAAATIATIAVEALSSHLQRKRQKAIEKSLKAMKETDQLFKHKLQQIESDFIMYGQYNLGNTESLIDTINLMDNRLQTLEGFASGSFEKTHSGMIDAPEFLYKTPSLYATQLLVFAFAMGEKHNSLYKLLIEELERILKAIAQLSRGYLPPEIFPPTVLQSIIDEVQEMVTKTHPDYTTALEGITNYYDMKLVTFARDEEGNLIITFPILLKQFSIRPLTLYEIETVPVPILDLNTKADSYSRVKIEKPYIASDLNYYIQIRIQELRMCKKIQYDYYCEELFLVKHKTAPSCEGTLFYDFPPKTVIEK